jgi:hypothetical protein
VVVQARDENLFIVDVLARERSFHFPLPLTLACLRPAFTSWKRYLVSVSKYNRCVGYIRTVFYILYIPQRLP